MERSVPTIPRMVKCIKLQYRPLQSVVLLHEHKKGVLPLQSYLPAFKRAKPPDALQEFSTNNLTPLTQTQMARFCGSCSPNNLEDTIPFSNPISHKAVGVKQAI